MFIGCQRLDMNTSTQLQPTDCQGCHQSPPPTGEHFYHLYTQNARPQIRCDDCHQTVIDKMNYDFKLTVVYTRLFHGFETRRVKNDSIMLAVPYIQEAAFNKCEIEIKGNVIYRTESDSITDPVQEVSEADSLKITYHEIIYFPVDSNWLKADPKTRGDKRYRSPETFDRCEYDYSKNTIYKRVLGPFTDKVLEFDERNNLTPLEELNSYYIFYPDTSLIDSLSFALVSLSQTNLSLLPETEQLKAVSIINGKEKVLEKQGVYYRLTKDSLTQLRIDTLTDFSQPVFATTTGLHGNGVVDLHFKNENFTFLKEDTVEVDSSLLTGEVNVITINRIGAWNPKRKTCWNSGVSSAECHNFLPGETRWYPKRELNKARLNLPGDHQ